jgi:menaquinone-dependent protoporphyrinogen oxidase
LVLVACATKYGATEGVAERIAAKLAEHGLSVEARRMDAVRDAGAYDVFVVGSAVYIGSWAKDAVQFVERNRRSSQSATGMRSMTGRRWSRKS